MEQWKDIPMYEGWYQVSDDGRVRRLVLVLPELHHSGVRKALRTLKQGSNEQGRLQVTLCKNGVTKRFQVHRLVLEAFKGPCPDGLEGCHDDGKHTNNRLSNLYWGTRQQNRADAVRHGTFPRGEVSSESKLTELDVHAIRASSDTQRVLADRYGVSQVAIHKVIKRKTWDHI